MNACVVLGAGNQPVTQPRDALRSASPPPALHAVRLPRTGAARSPRRAAQARAPHQGEGPLVRAARRAAAPRALAARPVGQRARAAHLPRRRGAREPRPAGRDRARDPAGQPVRLLRRRAVLERALRVPRRAAPRARAVLRRRRPGVRARRSLRRVHGLAAGGRQHHRLPRRAQSPGEGGGPLRHPRGARHVHAGADAGREARELPRLGGAARRGAARPAGSRRAS